MPIQNVEAGNREWHGCAVDDCVPSRSELVASFESFQSTRFTRPFCISLLRCHGGGNHAEHHYHGTGDSQMCPLVHCDLLMVVVKFMILPGKAQLRVASPRVIHLSPAKP